MSFNQSAFNALVDALQLRHFSANELLVGRWAKSDYGDRNSEPPLRLWQNIIPTILIVDELRATLGQKIKLLSGYRNEAYNNPRNNAGRSRRSQHQAYTALDIQVSGMAPEQVETILNQWHGKKWFFSPIWFERKSEKVGAGLIPFGALPLKIPLFGGGCLFTLHGFVKAYPGRNFTHIDTRGVTASTP